MRTTWERIDHWLAINAPQVLEQLNPGATAKEIAQTEAFWGISFPDDFKLSYRLHNGQDEDAYSLFPNLQFLPLESMIEMSETWQECTDENFSCAPEDIAEGIWNGWWHPHWLPFTYESNGACECVDLAPAAGGTVGQVITVEWQEAGRWLVAPSFRAYLETFAEALERGAYRFSEHGHGLVDLAEFAMLEADA
ncbi:SMI1/KNR4 family protein [Leptolyngbya sp. FACHB-321]|uniref:SMI1/KNR4 family protein n=1 Tax=Leptolyngbya sp. FACHB-321 TaxID=2692807 RepID=UPI0016837D12|nr:SMI1/KNR4 family protein [Leptolyngbya sp. FACHB-321]MBD2037899.1 SMI1/KNR4 family protein [Leptolyngbya sp. FACHB-321]